MDNTIKAKKLIKEIKTAKKGGEISPHKYILLFSISEVFDIHREHENNFTYSELEQIYLSNFNDYFDHFPDYRKVMEHPFYYLQNDGFWYLKIKKGKEQTYRSYQQKRLTRKRLLETVDYAYLDSEIYKLLQNPTARQAFQEELKNFIIGLSNEQRESNNGHKYVHETASLYEHEQVAISLINDSVQADDIGKLISNVLLHDSQSNNYFEIDILLATSFGLLVIELKHWSGHIRVNPYNWVVNEINYRSDPHKVNNFKAKIVKGIYQHHFKTFPEIWVESVVVLTNPDGIVEGANSPKIAAEQELKNPTLASIDDLVTYLKRKKENPRKQILSRQQVDAIIEYFSALNQPKQSIKYSVPGYETLEYISQKPECIEMVARPIHGRGKGLYRFRIFRTMPDMSQKEKERFIKKAHNTIQTISQIGDHPNIHKVWMINNEVGDIIEGSEWSETGTLRDLIFEKNHITVDQALKICSGVAKALKEAHENNVIHRAVKPENILMLNDVPKLINFDLAYQLEGNRLTVIEDASSLKDDGYIAPEILLDQDIDESTDYFSLGVIAYELLIGEKPFSSARAYEAQKGKLDEANLSKLKKLEIPFELVDLIERMLVADRDLRIKDITKILAALNIGEEEPHSPPTTVNRQLVPGETYDVYEIVNLIGKGRESQVYKAKTIREALVTLKLFNKDVPRERIIAESEVTSTINSSYVVRCENKIGHWKNDRYFIVLEYIPGVSLRDLIDTGNRPDLKTFNTITLGLMEAVRAFHYHKDSEGNKKPLLHGDIKPDNIIITKDKKGILIDCGISGEPRIDTFGGTIGYVPPDCLSGTDMSFSENVDLFALGITLWEWLFGKKPYERPSIGDKAIIPEVTDSELPVHLEKWLLKAVATEANERFLTIDDMQLAFTKLEDKAMPIKPPISGSTKSPSPHKVIQLTDEITSKDLAVGNPFVSYLNSLSSVSAGNENATAEAQITSDYFDRIEVLNPLTNFVYETLTSKRCNIILTGNAGDGKTTIAMDVLKKATGKRRPLKPIENLADLNLTIIKDMSEIDDTVRTSILEEAVNSDNCYLIISNTGTLMESFKELKDIGLKASDTELLESLEADKPHLVFDDHFLVLNIGRIDSIKTVCAIFKRMLEHDNWLACQKCSYINVCPIYKNVTLLQDRLDLVLRRIMLLYRKLFEYSARLTIRQMTGHLSYAVTAGLECGDIKSMSQTALQQNMNRYLFSNRFFGDDGIKISPESLQLFPIRQISREKFGIVPDPEFERKAWMGSQTSVSPIRDLKLPENISDKLLDDNNSAARQQLRRLVYFFGQMVDAEESRFISTYLHSPMLLEYVDLLEGAKEIPPAKESILRAKILQVLQEYFIGIKLPEDRRHNDDLYITIKQGTAGSGTQMVLADFRFDDFKLILMPYFTAGDTHKRKLCLKLHRGTELLDLDLPFFDYVALRYEGEMTEELSAYYTDRLERFKVGLIEHFYKDAVREGQNLRLMTVGHDRKFKFMKIAIDKNRLEVL